MNRTEAYQNLKQHLTRTNDLEGLGMLVDVILSRTDEVAVEHFTPRNGRKRGPSVGSGGGASPDEATRDFTAGAPA